MSNNTLIVAKSTTACRCCGQPLEQRTRPAHIHINGEGFPRKVAESSVVLCVTPDCPLESTSFMADEYATVDLSVYCSEVR